MWFCKRIRFVFQSVAITLLAFNSAQSASAAAPPTYVFSTFAGDHANEMTLRIYTSADGTNFTLYADTGYSGPPGCSLRDPSIMKYSDGRYYVVFTAPPYNKPYANQKFVGLAWSTNLQTWNTMPPIYTTNIPGVKLSWAPEWVAGSSDLPEFTVNCSSASSDLRPYLYTATSSDLTSWSGPVDIGIGSMYLDTQVLKVGDTWHCFTKSNLLQHATAPSITGPWTWLPNRADWVGLEGPCAVQLTNGSWMMCVDPMHDKFQYMTSADLTNWSALVYLPGQENIALPEKTYKHGTVIRDGAFNLPPTGLTATPGNSTVNLKWNSFNGAASYNVKRSLANGGPYALTANVAGTSFTDSNVTNNGTYHYVLSMIYGDSESPDSAAVTATPKVGYSAANELVACSPINASTGTLAASASAEPFVHPGGLHTQADLDRMKAKVAAGESPWIDDWNRLLADRQAQSNYVPAPRANMGVSRQRADADAHAAYLNALRWYISGDTNCAECAVRICNAWSASVNQVPTGQDMPGLIGIPVFDFALAGELLRIYPDWKPTEFNRFTHMMVQYFYPVCHGFLENHNGRCNSVYWANWDACNLGALIAMGVLCDNSKYYREGIEYYKHGAGMGAISNAVPYLYAGNLGQWQESGRDQEHAQLGVGLLGSACQVAWNQGEDLFGYADNRLLAGAEYVAMCNLSYPISSIPYTFYDNCSDARQCYLSINGLGRLDRPVWELIYNHYTVRRGLPASYAKAMAQLMRPERGNGDHFGYGTLTFTLKAATSPYPPLPIPPVPSGLTATPGVGQVFLNWVRSAGDAAQGYVVRRSTNRNGSFRDIASWSNHTVPQYADKSVANGVTYYYVIAAINQAGTSGDSAQASATPAAAGALPAGWLHRGIGSTGMPGSADYSEVSGNTFIVKAAGGNIGGVADALGFTHQEVTGDFVITGRLLNVDETGKGKVGLMVRESLAPEARAIALTLGEVGARQCRLGTRADASAAMTWQQGDDYTWAPVWFKIQRAGNTFTGFQSIDGTHWFKVGSSTASFANHCLVGLAVTVQKQDAFNTTVFDHVTVEGSSK
jgi:hypothetical protein